MVMWVERIDVVWRDVTVYWTGLDWSGVDYDGYDGVGAFIYASMQHMHSSMIDGHERRTPISRKNMNIMMVHEHDAPYDFLTLSIRLVMHVTILC